MKFAIIGTNFVADTLMDGAKELPEFELSVVCDIVEENAKKFAAKYDCKTFVTDYHDITPEMARTNIDIGGPCMIRASAKNYLRVASVTNPADYKSILDEVSQAGGVLSLATRFELMKKAFTHTAEYDKAIEDYFVGQPYESINKCYTIANT